MGVVVVVVVKRNVQGWRQRGGKPNLDFGVLAIVVFSCYFTKKPPEKIPWAWDNLLVTISDYFSLFLTIRFHPFVSTPFCSSERGGKGGKGGEGVGNVRGVGNEEI